MVFKLEKYHELFFNIIIFLNYFVYIVTFLGLYKFDPKYLDDFHFYFQLYICSFLIIHFFPFRKVRFEQVDRRIAFSSGIIIFTTVILNQLPIAKNVVKKIKDVKNKVKRQTLASFSASTRNIRFSWVLAACNRAPCPRARFRRAVGGRRGGGRP
jgi:hypothetical protein